MNALGTKWKWRWVSSDMAKKTSVYRYLKGGNPVAVARLFSVTLNDRSRGNGHRMKHRKFHTKHKKGLLHYEGDRALAQAA